MAVIHQPDPIVDPERVVEGFENLMPCLATHSDLLRTVIICHIVKACL
jgi:hypothetical protein